MWQVPQSGYEMGTPCVIRLYRNQSGSQSRVLISGSQSAAEWVIKAGLVRRS